MDGVGAHYRASRERLTDLLADLDAGDWSQPVPACPGWRVHDVVAHLVGVIEDGMAGKLDGPPDDSVTAEEVLRHRDDAPAELLARWQELAPLFEAVVTEREVWPAAFDALSHEHDIRGALGRPGSRSDVSVQLAAQLLIEGLDVAAVVHADLEHASVSSPPVDGPQLTVRTTAFEVLRLRLGRRSRDQVLALEWSSPPGDVVDELFVFGPRRGPLVE
ncbi:MAG: maleylpyruvate isomerase family mycothiol-dependent enzyme [Ilumatobacteraceae bacterium]